MANNKTFVIQINGIEKAYEDLGKLSERLGAIDTQIGNSKISTLISEAFGEASQIVLGFGKNINNLAAAVNGLQPLIAAIGTLQKLNTEAISTIENNNKKQAEETKNAAKDAAKTAVEVEKTKVEDIKIITVESLIQKGKILKELEERHLKEIEKLENRSKKYGDEIRYTEDSKKLYADYFAFLENLYKDDAEKLKKTSEEKEAYQKKETASITDIQKELDSALEIVKKNDVKTLIKELKNLSDIKKEANLNDLVIQKEFIKEEENLLTERNARIKALEESALEHNKRNFLGLNKIKKDESKANYEAIKKLRLENIADAKEEAKKVAAAYDQMAKAFEKGSKGEAVILEEKKNKLHAINEQILKDEAAVHDSRKALNEASKKYYEDLSKEITEYYTKYIQLYSTLGSATKDLLAVQISDLKEDQENTTKVIAAKTKAYEEHSAKVKTLEEEAKTATGGRSIVVQEQLAREKEAQKELLAEKKAAEKEKAEIDKQIARKEKQQKKIDLAQNIAKATADQAAAVIKAWGMGPILGPIMSVLTLAATIPMLLKMKQQWEKLEDGGLLRGKRHTQGGMRIEGTNIEVEGDEYVVNRISTRKNLGLIDYINHQRRELSPTDLTTYFARKGEAGTVQQHTIKHMYEEGGQLTNLEVIDAATAPDNDKILEAISRINFQPVVSVVDIATAQHGVARVIDIAGI